MKRPDPPNENRPRPDWLEQLRRSQQAFRPFIESGKMPDIVELIREEREKRDLQILEAVGVINLSDQRDSPDTARLAGESVEE